MVSSWRLGGFAASLGVLAILWAPACGEQAPPLERIVLVSLDTLRADQLGAHGYARQTSPAIERMASEGVRFAHVVAASNWTLPGHATMLTGLDPAVHRAFAFNQRSALPDTVVTLPELLRQHGFRTAAFVGGANVSRKRGFDQGFEIFEQPAKRFAWMTGRMVRETWDSGFDWLKAQRDHKAFLFLHTYQVHSPYTPPEPYDRIFDAGLPGPQRRRFLSKDLKEGGWAQRAAEQPQVVEQLRKLYDGEIRYADDFMGELLELLRDEGWAERSCVVLTSDHGEEFAEHGGLFHDTPKLTQELIGVPLIFWCPGRFRPGRVVDEPVGVVDVVPTLLDLAGLPVPEGLDGVSLVPLMRGEAPGPSRPLISDSDMSLEAGMLALGASDDFVLAVRLGRYKVVYRSDDESRRLYDLEADPGEQRDLADSRPDLMELLEPHLERAIARRREARPYGRPLSPADAAAEGDFVEQLRALGYVE